MEVSAAACEPILEPDLPIVDPHHHLWDHVSQRDPTRPPPTHPYHLVNQMVSHYLVDEMRADLQGAGHNVIGSVFVQGGSMYRAAGPVHMRPLGETEFVNGVAATFASGLYGPLRACAGIVGHADLTRSEAEVAELLDAHLRAAGPRFKGVRQMGAYLDEPEAHALMTMQKDLYPSSAFRNGFKALAPRGLSFDAWVFEPQLPDVTSLARDFPDTQIILNHAGGPVGRFSYEGRLEERFPIWSTSMQELARCPNVTVKVGGLGNYFVNLPSFLANPPRASTELAVEWKPYVETCIEAFGAGRCMFESDFPSDRASGDYATVWNAFKRLAAGCSVDEKMALFSGTAMHTYRLEL